jgi:CubicO group peptidase (beta-lactamase class C family)
MPIHNDQRAEIRHRIEESLDKEIAADFSGAVLVALGDDVLFEKSFGWTTTSKTYLISLDTLFCLASISKQFTATALLKLREKGKLQLDDSLDRFYKLVPEDKRPITLHHLLSHTSGIAQNYAADGITDREEAVSSILENPLVDRPGQSFHYANDNYNLLAAIVEIASDIPFEDFLLQQLFTLCGLSGFQFWGTFDDNDPIRVAEKSKPIPNENRAPNWGFRGATGIFGSVRSLYLWHQALLRGRLISATSLTELFRPRVKIDSGWAGYGWFITPTPRHTSEIWTRGTEDFGHNAILRWYREEELVIVCTSNAGMKGDFTASRRLSGELADIIFDTDDAPSSH